jgi:hypothetical protein
MQGLESKLAEEKKRLNQHLDVQDLDKQVKGRWRELELALKDDKWKILFPGKVLVAQFCSAAKIEKGYFRNLYIATARGREFLPFKDVLDIFSTWA